MNLLPAAGVAWLAAQLTQEFEAKQPSLADQIPGYGGGYGPTPGPSHTGNDKTTNPIPGGTSTTYPAEGPKESAVVGGKPLDPQKPGDSILPGKPAEPLPGIGPVFSEKNDSEDGVGVSGELKNISQQQLDKKFKHASDFGVITTKKNPDTLNQFGAAIESHMKSPSTIAHGTYDFVKDSKVFFDPQTNNAVILDGKGIFVTGFKLSPGTPQYENYMKNGVLR